MNIQEVICTNMPEQCCINVSVTYQLDTISGITKLSLTRTNMTTGIVKVLIDKSVSAMEELSFSYDDLEVVPGVRYRYIVVMTQADNTIVCQGVGYADCEFDGLSLADETSSWKTAFGTTDSRYSESYKRTRPVQYINTLSGKYPHRVSNSEANYASGSCTALWVPLGDKCGEPTFPEDCDQYRDAFIEFLMNGKDKLMRTRAKAYIVSIDGEVQENWNPDTKLTTVTFNWTQVGDLDKPVYTPTSPGWVKEVVT